MFPIFLSPIFLSAIFLSDSADRKMADRKMETRKIGSNRRPVQFNLERMDFAAYIFKLIVIVRRKSLVALFPQLLDFRFYRGSVNSFGVMVSECVNVESLADRGDQVFLVELRITHHGVVLDALGDFAQLGHGFVFEFFVGVLSHDFNSPLKMVSFRFQLAS